MPSITGTTLSLRPATADDAELYARLRAETDPDDLMDVVLVRHWWEITEIDRVVKRYVVERRRAGVGFCSWGHDRWDRTSGRYGRIEVLLGGGERTEASMADLYAAMERCLSEEGASSFQTVVREGAEFELGVLDRLGYRHDRLARWWQLDLEASASRIQALAEVARARMRSAGIELTTLDRVRAPGLLRRLYEMGVAGELDVPTTVPAVPASFEAFLKDLDSPGSPPDRVWLAMAGEEVVGVSWLRYPPGRGDVWTEWTTTAAHARGGGVARALKLETVLQARSLGVRRVRTANDEANLPILHLNREMGYELIPGEVFLLKEP